MDAWQPLLIACDDYARLSGWRFTLAEFMRMDGEAQRPELHAARIRAMPTALEYADRVTRLVSSQVPPEQSPLLGEFCACQRLVASEAIYRTMLSTVTALGLTREAVAAQKSDDDGESCAYQDLSVPLEEIARRLHRYDSTHAELREARKTRLHAASFIVEFGLEHGLPELKDPTSEAQLTEFLERVREWPGQDEASRDLVRALVVDSLPEKAGSLRRTAADWFQSQSNETQWLLGGAAVAGVAGLLIAGAAIVAKGAARAKR
jgi:hypothetical protein